MPHHSVKKDSTTTALRVVFNASQKTSNGKSFNEQCAIGRATQTDLMSLLIKFRIFKFVFTADVEKMYKQIMMHEDQRDLQRFVYRFGPVEPIRDFRWKAVTFGIANAPYLAIRTLKELANREKDKYPIAASVIESCMYVDDAIGGCHSQEELYTTYDQLKKSFDSVGMNLRKWSSNSPEFLSTIPEKDKEMKALNANIKALGISWSSTTDDFMYDFSIPSSTIPNTKRKLTSEIAKLFDPLGWISPVILKSRRVLQLLWKANVDWDTELPNALFENWLKIKSELHLINNLKIPRWVNYNPNHVIELHGFCDAAEIGYAAGIYLKNVTENTVNLLAAKARVAPIKEESNSNNVTIPRLELCGALLLAQLMKKVLEALNLKVDRVCFWTDSKIVLGWIHGNPKRYKTFVARRILKIVKINNQINKSCWNHVVSEENAADCA